MSGRVGVESELDSTFDKRCFPPRSIVTISFSFFVDHLPLFRYFSLPPAIIAIIKPRSPRYLAAIASCPPNTLLRKCVRFPLLFISTFRSRYISHRSSIANPVAHLRKGPSLRTLLRSIRPPTKPPDAFDPQVRSSAPAPLGSHQLNPSSYRPSH